MLGVPIKSRYTDTSSGYIKLYLADGSVVEEHRYVMTQLLGRELSPDEVVHHKDHNKQHNDPSNLELRTDSDHKAEHSSKTHDEKHTTLKCRWCGKEFERLTRKVNEKKKKGQKRFYCNKSCATSQQNAFAKTIRERNKRRREKYKHNKQLEEQKKEN